MDPAVLDQRIPRLSGIIAALAVVVLACFLVQSVLPNFTITDDADAIRNIQGYILMDESGSDMKGNVLELYTGPGESKFSGQVTGIVYLYRTSKVLRDRVDVDIKFTTDNPSLVLGSVNPPVYTIQPGAKIGQIPIVVNIRLASPMLDYSTGLNGLVKVTVWGEWDAQWSAGTGTVHDSGPIEPTYIYVHVNPYHYLQMAFDPPMIDMSPGGTGEIDVIVLNTGNGMERVDLSIPYEAIYAKEGWVFEFNQTTLDIGPKSEERVTIRVTAPRETIRWHMDTKDFNVKAVSYYDTFRTIELDGVEPTSYEMTFMVYIFGLDFTYVPWAWAIIFWLVMALILFNIGINPLVMRKRRLPGGVDPGFIALYHYMSNPERRAKVDEARKRKKKLKLAEKERKLEERRKRKEADNAIAVKSGGSRASTLKMSPSDDDFEIDIEVAEPSPSKRKTVPADDFDIMLEAPRKRSENPPKKPLFSGKKNMGRSEKDLASALEDL